MIPVYTKIQGTTARFNINTDDIDDARERVKEQLFNKDVPVLAVVPKTKNVIESQKEIYDEPECQKAVA